MLSVVLLAALSATKLDKKVHFWGFSKFHAARHKMIVYKIMDTQITAMKEITKQMQGSIIFVNRDELNASDSRQSEIFQNEQNRKRNINSSVTDITFVHDENLKKIWLVRIGLRHLANSKELSIYNSTIQSLNL